MSDAVAAETTGAESPKAPDASAEPIDEMAAALAAVEAAGEPDETKKEPDAKDEPKKESKGEDDKDKDLDEKGPAAKGWAAIRRLEQKYQKRAKEVEAKEQQINARIQQMEQHAKELQQRAQDLEQDPVAYLTKKGLSFDDLAKRYLNDGKASPEEMARRAQTQGSDEIRELKENQARLEAALQQSKIDKLVNDYRADIKGAIGSDDLELLRAWPDAESEVLDFANKWAEQKNEVLTPRDAALKLQEALRKQLSTLLSHQAVLKLVNAGNGAQLKQVVSGQGQVPRGQGASPKTLTNNLAATPAAEPNLDPMDEEEELQAALRLVQA